MIRRGDVIIVDFPYTSGSQSKIRPALVIQNDRDNARLLKTVVAMISGNTRRAGEATQLLVDPASTEGASSGLHGPSVVICVNLFTIEQGDVIRTIGSLSAASLPALDSCLKAALDIH